MLAFALLLCLPAILVHGDDGRPAVVATLPADHSITQGLPDSAGGVTTDEKPTVKLPVTAMAPPNTTTEATTITTIPTIPTIPTTVAPNTTTVAPNITTVAPNTTTSTTTQAPDTTTSTTAMPTTTSAPTSSTPVPEPSMGKWIVNGTNKTCIVVQMAVQFNVSYSTSSGKKAYRILDIPVPKDNSSLANGVCGAMEQNMTISWMSSTSEKDNLTLHFVKNETTKQYSLSRLEIALPPSELPNYSSNKSVVLVHNSSLFATGLTGSYRCIRSQMLDLSESDNANVTGRLTVSDLQFQAFRTDSTTVFGLAKDCAFDTPDIVPIAVGCALAALVVIVLFAYLVGRRRSQARGYLSM